MKFRKLRIAWSVGWGLIAILLLTLWLRSYTWGLSIECHVIETYTVAMGANQGAVVFAVSHLETADEIQNNFQDSPLKIYNEPSTPAPPDASSWELGTNPSSPTSYIQTPLWLPTLLLAIFAAVPWVHSFRHFSLRTLLLATTLIAVVLGTIGWLAHK